METLLKNHPRLRGEKVDYLPVVYVQVGITPAGAGKSFLTSSFFVSNKDHPHVCGEKATDGAFI